MQAGLRRKIQFIRHCADLAQDLKRPEKSRRELQIFPDGNGVLLVRLETQVNPISRVELTVYSVFIRISLHAVLSLVKVLLE
jgi:hypothetical protein